MSKVSFRIYLHNREFTLLHPFVVYLAPVRVHTSNYATQVQQAFGIIIPPPEAYVSKPRISYWVPMITIVTSHFRSLIVPRHIAYFSTPLTSYRVPVMTLVATRFRPAIVLLPVAYPIILLTNNILSFQWIYRNIFCKTESDVGKGCRKISYRNRYNKNAKVGCKPCLTHTDINAHLMDL